MNKKTILEYARLKIEAKRIEENIKLLMPQVLKDVQEIRGDSGQPVTLEEFPGCSFTIQNRKIWKFSKIVEDAAKALEARKEDEKADGTATYTESQQLMFLS